MQDPTAAPSLPEQGQVIPATIEDWTREVVPRLPAHLEQHAKVLKAFERRRQVSSATDLLRGLLAYVYAVHSFKHLSIWSVLVGVADVSANDWRKRLQRASAWLSWLLQEVLASTTQTSPFLLRGGWRRVMLIDGTHFKCPGPQGMVWRVHIAFDLLAGRLTQLRVTDHHVGEQLELFDLQAGDLRAGCIGWTGAGSDGLDVFSRRADRLAVGGHTPESKATSREPAAQKAQGE